MSVNLVLALLFVYGAQALTPPPGHTLGQPWPMPQKISQTGDIQSLSQDNFRFNTTGQDCDILQDAVRRYARIIFYPGWDGAKKVQDDTLRFRPAHARHRRQVKDAPRLMALEINLANPCEDLPYLGMDEAYKLSIATGAAKLTTNSVWGALRGLETFSQIVYQDDSGMFLVKNTEITDFPRFSHRGILLDSSRHFLPVPVLKTVLEGFAYNKMNVFHWHIVDENSFPYQSTSFPELSEKGAYDPYSHIYSQEDVKEIIRFARLRGIRVVPEFDTPGHTGCWGNSQPELLTQCCGPDGKFNGNYGPIDPSRNSTYGFLSVLMKELTQVFPDKYIHLGGDEVSFACWQSNPNITAFMKKMGFGTNYALLENYYEAQLLGIVNGYNHDYIVWEEVFDNGVKVRPDTVVQAWLGSWQKTLDRITSAGLRALVSSPWYLDYISYGPDWQSYYKVEPLDGWNATDAQLKLFMGGEACLWGEFVDGTNVVSRLWPRASAVAERLWSPRSANDTGEAHGRLEEHRCRMVKRGLNAQPPQGPNYCQYEWGQQQNAALW